MYAAINSFIGQIMWKIAQNHWIPWIHHENMSTTPISDIRHVYQMITPSDLMGWFHGIERATSKMSKCLVVKVLDDKYQSFDRMDFSMDFSIPDVQISKLYNYLIQIFDQSFLFPFECNLLFITISKYRHASMWSANHLTISRQV